MLASIRSVTISTSTQAVKLEPVIQRQYYRLRYDWEANSEYNGKLRAVAPCPGVLNFQQMQHNKLDEKWQRFWFGLNRTHNFAADVRAFNTYANSQAFLTDSSGVDFNKNFITNENMDKDFPRIETKGCAGNVVCIVGEPLPMWKGWLWARIETMDITKPPPVGVTYRTHPHLIHHATNLARSASGYVCNPFTHLGGRNTGIPILFPVTSRGAVYYPYRFLQRLPFGVVPNPYMPPM